MPKSPNFGPKHPSTHVARPTPRRRQRRSRRRAVWLGAVALVAAAVVAFAVSRAGDDTGDDAGAPAASAPATAGFTGGDFHSLVVDPTTSGRLFVGGHEAVSSSTDGGKTWARVAALDNADAMGWAFAGDSVYVTGHPGIKHSADGAATFRQANDGLPDTDVHAFGASDTVRYAAGPRNGVVASTDGGRTWTNRTKAAGQSFFGRILVGPGDDEHLIAADARGGATESTDGGRTWRRLGGPPSATWVSRSGVTLYASGPQGAARTSDGGTTWENLELPEGVALVEGDDRDPSVVYAGVHDGKAVSVLVSRDRGTRWTRP